MFSGFYVPSAVAYLVSSASVLGFSGSRVAAPGAEEQIAEISRFVPSSSVVVVGCARGVDQIAREIFPSARVFRVASGDYGRGRAAFARRSSACIEATRGGLWLSFPASSCPSGVSPGKKAFNGSGSGSWSSLGYALGLGVRCVLWLPSGVAAPVGWGLVSSGGGWFVSAPAPVQLSLF